MSSLGSERGRGGGGRDTSRPLTLMDVYDIAADIGKVRLIFNVPSPLFAPSTPFFKF
jgi:hypothetical protein